MPSPAESSRADLAAIRVVVTRVIPRVTPAVTNHSTSPSGCQGDPHSHSTAIRRQTGLAELIALAEGTLVEVRVSGIDSKLQRRILAALICSICRRGNHLRRSTIPM